MYMGKLTEFIKETAKAVKDSIRVYKIITEDPINKFLSNPKEYVEYNN